MPPPFSISRRNELVALNTGLVYAVVRSVGVDPSASIYDDCVQEGMIGLSRAAERFKASFGVAFATFAWRWIAGAVKTCLCRSSIVTEPVRRVSRRAAQRARDKAAGAERVEAAFAICWHYCDGGGQVGKGKNHLLPESMIDHDAEDDAADRLDMKALQVAITKLPRAEREVIRAALRGTPVSHYARRRGWSRDKTSTLLRQATETLQARMAGIECCEQTQEG